MKTVTKCKKDLMKMLILTIALFTGSITYASSGQPALTEMGKQTIHERAMYPTYLTNGRLQKLLLHTKTGECIKQIPWLKQSLLNDDVIEAVSYDVGGGRFEVVISPAFSEFDRIHSPLSECFDTFNQEFEVETSDRRSNGKLVDF